MSEEQHGVRATLKIPRVYEFFVSLLGDSRVRETLTTSFIRPFDGAKVLDIGCGPGLMVPYLRNTEYYGYDVSEEYINAARHRFGDGYRFEQARVSNTNLPHSNYFDVVIAVGLLHHLDDAEAEDLFQLALSALAPNGRLVTFDGCYEPGQPRVAKWLLDRDRGKHVRDEHGYTRLAKRSFSSVQATVHRDLLRIPYTHITLVCTKQA